MPKKTFRTLTVGISNIKYTLKIALTPRMLLLLLLLVLQPTTRKLNSKIRKKNDEPRTQKTRESSISHFNFIFLGHTSCDKCYFFLSSECVYSGFNRFLSFTLPFVKSIFCCVFLLLVLIFCCCKRKRQPHLWIFFLSYSSRIEAPQILLKRMVYAMRVIHRPRRTLTHTHIEQCQCLKKFQTHILRYVTTQPQNSILQKTRRLFYKKLKEMKSH